MARLPNLDLPGIPQHIVQRGTNRLPRFLDDGDRLRYLPALQEALMTTGVQLHAYTLIDNHLLPLAMPATTGDIVRRMRRLGRQSVGRFNMAGASQDPALSAANARLDLRHAWNIVLA